MAAQIMIFSAHVLRKSKSRLTSFTSAVPEAGCRAVANEAVPSLLAKSVVLARVAVALFPRHLAAGGLDTRRILGRGDLSDIFAAPVDEKIPDAAHVAVVEHGGPELSGENQTRAVVRKTAKIKIPLQV